jgi:hypothetical protein
VDRSHRTDNGCFRIGPPGLLGFSVDDQFALLIEAIQKSKRAVELLKLLSIVHHLARQSSSPLMSKLAASFKHREDCFAALYELSADQVDCQVAGQTSVDPRFANALLQLIRRYARYLREKCLMFALLNTQIERHPSACDPLLCHRGAARLVQSVQSQLNAAINTYGVG